MGSGAENASKSDFPRHSSLQGENRKERKEGKMEKESTKLENKAQQANDASMGISSTFSI